MAGLPDRIHIAPLHALLGRVCSSDTNKYTNRCIGVGEQPKADAVKRVTAPPETKMSGDLEIDRCFGR